MGCGSGPLFAPLAAQGIHVTGIDPADAMVALAKEQAAVFPSLITVEQRGWESIEETDAYDLAVALGVFDYVGDPVALLTRMGRAAPHVVGSFPAPGLRLLLRKVRYGARGVGVHGYPGERVRAPRRRLGPRGGRGASSGSGRLRGPLPSGPGCLGSVAPGSYRTNRRWDEGALSRTPSRPRR